MLGVLMKKLMKYQGFSIISCIFLAIGLIINAAERISGVTKLLPVPQVCYGVAFILQLITLFIIRRNKEVFESNKAGNRAAKFAAIISAIIFMILAIFFILSL